MSVSEIRGLLTQMLTPHSAALHAGYSNLNQNAVIMNSRIFWINSDTLNSLAIMARPRAGEWLEDEVANYKQEGINIVISLLEPHEVIELELQQESQICEEAGIIFLSFPIADRGTPLSMIDTKQFIEKVSAYAKQHKKIAVHCRAGIGRSSMIAATLLLYFGHNTNSAFKVISDSRGVNVPDTQEQKQWVFDYERTTSPARSG